MLMALGTFDLRIPASGSLKEKRHVVKGLVSGIRSRFNVAVAEVDHLDLRQRARIAVGAVGAEGYHLKKVMHEVERFVSRDPSVEIIDSVLTLHSQDD